MSQLIQDVKYGLRTLGRTPAFTIVAIVTLGLGIGAGTAIFSVVNAVLLRPLPYADASRLALVISDMRNRHVDDFPIAPGDLGDMQRQLTTFSGIAGITTFRGPISGNDVPPEQIPIAVVTWNTFPLLGMKVEMGRDFVAEDGTPNQQLPQPAPGAPPPAANTPPPPRLPVIAVLSHEFFVRRFGADRSIVGKGIDLGGQQAAQVVGVLQPGAELLFPPSTNIERRPAVWIASRADLVNGSRINVQFRAVGRMKPGVTLGQVQSQLDALGNDLRLRYPIKQTAGVYFRTQQMHENLVAEVRPAIVALMGAVVFVLLIACANVANLLLVRASQREHEMAVRAALGGDRGRLIRQLLAESLVLASGGVILGLVLARLGIALLVQLGPSDLPRLDDVALDPFVLVFAIVAAMASVLVFGMVPALRAAKAEAVDALRAGGRAIGRAGGHKLSSGVVIAEVALSFVLLIGSGLMVRSFIALQNADPGFDPAGLLTFRVSNFRARTPEEAAARQREVHDKLAAIPGVGGVTAASPMPLDGRTTNMRYGTEAAEQDPSLFQQADIKFVLPGYFEVMKTQLIAGRTFTEADNDPKQLVVIIDDELAKKTFHNEPAVGKRLFARTRSNDAEWLDIIGVVKHQRHATLAVDGREGAFFTDGFVGHLAADRWAIRTSGDPSRLEPTVRAALHDLNPMLVISELQPMSAWVDRAQAQTRFTMTLIGVFAVIAVILASVGLYGVLATLVRQRTAEIGVRLAFGAEPGTILQLIIGQGLRLSGVGIVIGLAAAFALTRAMAGMLVGVTPTDPVTFVSIAVLFLLIVAFASWLPARRAARLHPMVALRND